MLKDLDVKVTWSRVLNLLLQGLCWVNLNCLIEIDCESTRIIDFDKIDNLHVDYDVKEIIECGYTYLCFVWKDINYEILIVR